ncbi:MAG: STAS domain-containing protein [Acidimicrobiales bacterium]|jgi:ABC-type transporter Mla MlaB component
MLILDGSLSVDSVIALESQFDQLVSSEVDHVVLDIDALHVLDNAGIDTLARLVQLMDGQHAVVSIRSEQWPQDACSTP